MIPPIVFCAEILALELPELADERQAVNLLAAVGFAPRSTAPIIDVIASLARDLRADLADREADHAD